MKLSEYIDEMNVNGQLDYADYNNLRDMADDLEVENVELRERLEKAVVFPCVKVVKTKEWIDKVELGDTIWEWAVIYIDKQGEFVVEPCMSKISAEARLVELEGGNKQ